MATPLELVRSRTYPFPVEQAFEFTLPAPLPAIFSGWYGPLPPIAGVDGPEPWGEVGESRRIRTVDGGTMREELVVVEAPNRFTYRLSEITGPLKVLAGSIDGSWAFQPVGTGTRITWGWTIHPASEVASAVMPALRPMWNGYARRALDQLDQLMVAALG